MSAARQAALQGPDPGEPIEATLARMTEGALEDLKKQRPLVLGRDAGQGATRDGARPARQEVSRGGCLALLFLMFALSLLVLGLRWGSGRPDRTAGFVHRAGSSNSASLAKRPATHARFDPASGLGDRVPGYPVAATASMDRMICVPAVVLWAEESPKERYALAVEELKGR